MRNIEIAPEEHYHVFNRGVNKGTIFHDVGDYSRFLFLILHLQSKENFPQIGRSVKNYVKHRVFDIDAEEIIKLRTIELVSFCIMPNHFHLILKEVEDGGISVYMQRVLNAYAKYYNTKYNKSGHVFQGPYKAVHITDDRQLLYLSAYIHRNPREISSWLNKEKNYPWSSYQDFIEENRWGGLLSREIILGQFKNSKKYKEFIETSTAKMIKDELDNLED